MPTIALNGRRAHYHDGGGAWRPHQPRVVFVHGAGGTHVVWQPQSRAIAHAGYNVLVADLPGHGASEDDPAIRTVEDYAAWLRRLIGAVTAERGGGSSPLFVIGHSLGACIAVSYGALWSGEVAGLMLVGASLEMKVNPALLKDCQEDLPRAADFITSFGHGRAAHLSTGTAPGAWVLGASRALLLASDPNVLQRDFAVCGAWQGRLHAAKVACPALVVAGAQDRMTPAKSARQLADAIPGARYEVLAGVGHMVPAEAPRALLRLLEGFLAGVRT
ncbi:MAG: alpha/beta fold hydrolase [SAR324 cluster bacterium]